MGDELRGLVHRQQAFHAARDCRSIRCVEMKHATGILADLMDRRMDGEARRVDAVFALAELVAVKIDLHEARRGDFLEHQPVRVDQEVMVRPRHARRDVGVDQVVPAVQRDETIAGGEIDALVPLGVRHAGGNLLQASFGWRHGALSPKNC